MKQFLFTLLSVCAFASANASWYWPFGDDEANTNKPPRLHKLLEKANDLIELGEEESLNGEGEKAIDYYAQALDELARVARENPERAQTSEFAPLRNKQATCQAAIESIRFAQVNANAKAVAISDTTELQKKWNAKHGIKNPEDEKPKKEKPAVKEAPAPGPTKPAEKPAEVKIDPTSPEGLMRSGDFASADRLLEKMLVDKPSDLRLLLLRAAAQSGLKSFYAARRTLEKAMRAHPKSYYPYYNMVYVALELKESVKAVREYYDMGRAVGGPANTAIEARLNELEKEKK